jgi:hypothetical protein
MITAGVPAFNLAGVQAGKEVLHVPSLGHHRQIERRRRHRPHRHRQIRQSRFGNQPTGRRRGIEDRDLVAAIGKRARNGNHARGKTKIIGRKHGDEKSGHSPPCESLTL